MLLGGNNAQMALGVRFYLKDQFSTPARRMTSALKGYRTEFSAFQENLRSARNVSAGMAAAGAIAVRSMANAVRSGSEFLYTMRGVEVISEGTTIQMEKINKLAISLARQTIFKPNEIASGMRFMAMAGQSAVTIYKTIKAAADLSQASMTALGGKMGGADIMTNALKAFGWQAERSSEMADLLVTAVTNANISLLDLGNSIRYAAATSRNLKIPVQEVIGMLMVLGNAGIQSSMAGTAIENMYRYLAQSVGANATARATKTWAKLGLTVKDITDAAGNFKPLTQILALVGEQMKELKSYEIQDVFKQLFGVRGLRGGATIARNLSNAQAFVDLLSSDKIRGAAGQKSSQMMDTLKGDLNKLVSTLEGFYVAFTKGIQGPLRVIIDGLKKTLGLLTRLVDTPVGRFFSTLIAGFIAIVTPILIVRTAIIGLAFAMKSLMVTSAGMSSSVRMMFTMMAGGSMATASGMAAAATTSRMAMASANMPYVLGTGERAGFNKRGLTYIRGASGRMRGTLKRGVGVVAASPAKYIKSLARSSGKMARGMGILRGVGGGLMGAMGGPVGLAITGLAIAVPMLISRLSRNAQAVKDNTAALRDKYSLPGGHQFYALIQGRKVQEVLEIISANLARGIESGEIDRQALKEILIGTNQEAYIKYLNDHGKTLYNTFELPSQ